MNNNTSDGKKENVKSCASEVWGRNLILQCPKCNEEMQIQHISCNTCINSKIRIINKLKKEILQLKEQINAKN